jgi:uroporphyrinogen decarboxylase
MCDRRPDFTNLRRTLLRTGPPGPVPFIELFIDPGLIQAILGESVSWDLLLAAHWNPSEGAEVLRKALDAVLRFCGRQDYDYVWGWTGLRFPRVNYQVAKDSATTANWSSGARFWQDEGTGPIQSWADFEAYPWPRAEHISYAALEYLERTLPDGMKISVNIGGIFEESSWLMGLQSFSYALHDQPELVAAICQRVGALAVAAVRNAAAIDGVGLVFLGDDLGHAGGTLVSPQVLRQHIFPHYRRMVEAVHDAGKLLLLHSCGNLARIMDELVEIGFDAKHSYEDKIMPVEEVHRRWGDRIAILGGVDMDLLTRGSEAEVRKRTRAILEACAAKGTGYCLGTGNSGANYVAPRNFLAMLDEGRQWNRENFPNA